MKRGIIVFFIFIPSLFFITGCWDSVELNNRSIEIALGIDKAPNKGVQLTTQIVVPANVKGGQKDRGSQGKAYLNKSDIGKDSSDAYQQLQTHLSRQLFPGHRHIIVIGEPLAREGIKDILDVYTRNPNISLRTDIFIVKGGTAEDFLKASYPLENLPGVGVIKGNTQLGVPKGVSFLNFLLSATSEGSSPTLSAITIGSSHPSKGGEGQEEGLNTKGFSFVGTGIFDNDLKLIGFLNMDESRILHWILKNLDRQMITAYVHQEKEYVSLDVNKMDSKIQPILLGNKIKFLVTLMGEGMIRESNTGLDLTLTKNITLIENELEKHVEKNVLKTIIKVQKTYGKDVFGFSDVIFREYPQQWKSLKKDWDKEFPEADISVKANLTVRRIGTTGPSLID